MHRMGLDWLRPEKEQREWPGWGLRAQKKPDCSSEALSSYIFEPMLRRKEKKEKKPKEVLAMQKGKS